MNKILISIFASIALILGIGAVLSFIQSKIKYLGLLLGGLTYIISAFLAFHYTSWLPIIICFFLTHIIRIIFGGDN